MNKIIRLISLTLAAASAAAVLNPTCFAAGKKSSADFIHAEGRVLKHSDGSDYLIKGIALGNNVWSDPSDPPVGDHNEDSFKEIAELGFNSVRFYLNALLFEQIPYKYRETGFDWLDKNIAWAKKYGIRLVLNMHYPQGGYQSQGNGDQLWTKKENAERLKALWTEIARRYADEPAILGYGLVNEPIPVGGVKVWEKLANDITDSIRRYDKNHIIFAEKICGKKDTASSAISWDIADDEWFPLISDSNVVYEFHSYDPFEFTHQDFDWAGTQGTEATYPDKNRIAATGNTWLSCSDGKTASVSVSGWQYVESDMIYITRTDVNVLGFSFQAANLGKDGVCYADDLYIKEYDKNGKLIKTIPVEDSKTKGSPWFWSSDGSGSGSFSYDTGRDDKRSFCIRGTVGDANLSQIKLLYTKGHTYKVSGYFNLLNASSSAIVRPRLDMYHSEKTGVSDKQLLIDSIADVRAFSEKHNVPIYCGEFGAGRHCFENGRGGETWVEDMLDIFIENRIGFNYHMYNEYSFGLRYDINGSSEMLLNEPLAKIFAEKLSAADLSRSISSLDISAVSAVTYTGKKQKPDVTVKDGSYTLIRGKDYTLSYKNNTGIGKASVTIKGKGIYTGSRTLSFKIIPARPALKIKPLGNGLRLTWSASAGADGYRIYRSDNGGKTYKAIKTVKGNKTSCTLKTGADGRYTYVIRAYKTTDNTVIYSSRSKPVKAKV